MFYPVESLKRGGRFYLCWVADSWPLRFATITHRQLWSQDIRRICDDLLEVMTNESGRPANRFSLRLSSQLMRGLVRLYQRKVTVFLSDLCMINATVTKNVNKKWYIHEVEVEGVGHRPLPPLIPQQLAIQEEPENEQRIEEIIQNSGNVVGNIQDITLKESAIPQLLLPPNDGFGEENPDQALQMLANQTLEMMLVQDASAIQHSGLELATFNTTGDKSHDKSHDKSRAPHDAPTMERIEELDVTLFQKSNTAEDRLTMGGLEKDVSEIPEIPIPDFPGQPPAVPTVEEPQPMDIIPISEAEKPSQPVESTAKEREPVEIELEELEEIEPATKRRRLKKLIVDKKIKLAAEYLIARIDNPLVELRCEDSSDDIIELRVPAEVYLRRCAHAGARLRGGVGRPLARLFLRNLGVFRRQDFADREMEEAVAERTRRPRTRSILERIEEERELLISDRPQIQIDQPLPDLETREGFNAPEAQNVTLPQESYVVEPPNITVMQPEDIADLPTQRLEVLSETRKRTSDYEVSPKRQRLIGYVSFRQSQQTAVETALDMEAEKENISSAANVQSVTRSQASQQSPEKSLTVMLQEVGLADLPPSRPDEQASVRNELAADSRPARKGSESSETQLGSLDRTKVSLGDSDQTTDSKRFIKEQWGTEGTMVSILRGLRWARAAAARLTLRRLVARGPRVPGCGALVAARCFTSILKLKQHGFIIIKKDPETLEIREILLGPKFDQVQ